MFLKSLLFPFSVVYGWIMEIRNSLYDNGLRPSIGFEIPVICVGNLTVGGTGKTPMVEYLVNLLSPPRKVGTLSRGYGRATKGFRHAGPGDNARTVGDEPFQFFRKFRDRVVVAVGEERALAIPLMLQACPELEVVILDDAFQHRAVKPSLTLLLCDYTRPFYDDFILPMGRLRESKHNAGRADAIIVTKCPSTITDDVMMDMEKSIREIVTRPVFFTTVNYSSPVPFEDTVVPFPDAVVLVSGIGNPHPLAEYVKRHYNMVHHLVYRDHHAYTVRDLKQIEQLIQDHPGAAVMTTEKDMVKLERPEFHSFLRRIPFFYLPITVQFLKEAREFDEIILSHVSAEL